jgi:hypothetical protein
MFDVTLESPNLSIVGRLKYEHEIRFGPRYYSLHIKNLGLLKNRLFGSPFLWSSDSRYLVLQEWMTTNESDGPWTRLLLIDFQTKLGKWLSGARGGFIRPIKFEDGKLVYVKDFQNSSTEYEIDIKSLMDWENLEWI